MEHFDTVEVEAENEREARKAVVSKALKDQLMWTEREKPSFKTEIINN
jgi:hypothetical protein